MGIKKIDLRIGLQSPVKLLHISDTHLSFADSRDDACKMKLAEKRSQLFENGTHACLIHLLNAMDYAVEHCDLLVHTGDLIDFVSYRNLDLVKGIMGDLDYFFVAGNHEFSKYVGEAVEDEAYKQDSLPLVQQAFKHDIRFCSRVVGGLNLVGIDNSYYHFNREHIELFKAEVLKGLPIILFVHNPFYTAELFDECIRARGNSYASIMGCPDDLIAGYSKDRFEQQRATDEDMAMIDYLKSLSLIKAVFAGHLHYFYESQWSDTARQYVVGGNFSGDAHEIVIT